jgi:hypothetical protein
MAIRILKRGEVVRGGGLCEEMPALQVRAEVQNVDKANRTFEIVWSTGARVPRWFGHEELSMDPAHVRMGRLTSGKAPFLGNHDSYRVEDQPGVIESASISKGAGYAKVRMVRAGVDPEADKLFEKIDDKIVRNVSVGYRVHKFEKVEGGDETIPVYRAVDWEPYEVSAVSIGADAAAGFRSAEKEQFNPCVFVTRQEKPHVNEEELKRQQEAQAAEQKRAADELAAKNATDAARAAAEAATKAERTRVDGIQHAFRAAKLEASELNVDEHIRNGTTVEAFRDLVIDALAKRDSAPISSHQRIQVVETDNEKFRSGVVAALLFRANLAAMFDEAKRRNPDEFKDVDVRASNQFRGASISDIARLCLTRAGVKHDHIYSRERLFSLAIQASYDAKRGGYQSGGDFPILFEDALRKSMRAAYATQADTWRRWVGTDSVPDFKESHRYMRGSFGTLPVVGENEEYKNLEIPDGSKISISTEKRGAIIALTYESLINDDMGALAATAATFGTTAGRTIESAVYALLAQNSGLGPTMSDSQPFFHSNRANVSTSAALSGAALSADRKKMRAQKDSSDNDFLDLEPRILLVPEALEDSARSINTDTYDHDGSKVMKNNLYKAMFNDVVTSPRLTASATRRYLFTEGKEAFKVVFRDGGGAEGPVLEQREGFRTDGIEWKARVEFKVNPYDPKTAITNAGT